MSTPPWNTLPNELKLHTISFLELACVKSLSEASIKTRELCAPTLFRNIALNNYEALSEFKCHFDRYYYGYIRSLSICFKPSSPAVGSIDQASPLVDILSSATKVESLSLHFIGSPTKKIIPSFRNLHDLKSLDISNCGNRNLQLLSERLVVSIALAIRKLQQLTLDGIARSQIHAPDLLYRTIIPTVVGDGDIEDHPAVGSELSLPSLLQIPTLQQLRIRDTHLGDPLWETVTCLAPISVLDLGSYCHVSPEVKSSHVGKIIKNVAGTSPITRLTIAAGLEQTIPLRSLHRLELSSFFSVDRIVDTLSTLSGSPIETIAVQCFHDDVEDLCEELETFLNERVGRESSRFHHQLKRLIITLISLDAIEQVADISSSQPYWGLEECQRVTITKLEDFCSDLGLEFIINASALRLGPPHTSTRSSIEEAALISKTLASSC